MMLAIVLTALVALVLLSVLGTVTYTHTRSLSDGTAVTTGSYAVTNGQALIIDEAIPANQTNLQLTSFAFTVAKLKSVYLLADVAMTIKTNSSGSPQETINLKAGSPMEWIYDDGYFTVPFGGNVTTAYVTNTTAGTLKIKAVLDAT